MANCEKVMLDPQTLPDKFINLLFNLLYFIFYSTTEEFYKIDSLEKQNNMINYLKLSVV